MTRIAAVILLLLASTALVAQKPLPGDADAPTEFVANPIPAFHENKTFRFNLIARVLHQSPLIVEFLDSEIQTIDRAMKVVEEKRPLEREPVSCPGPQRVPVVDLAAKPLVSTLKLNDVVSGSMIMMRDEKKPNAILAGTLVLTNVRKVPGPVKFFRDTGAGAPCANRSGTAVMYSTDEEDTIVFNDGGIYYRSAAYVTFQREKLTRTELSDLFAVFRDVNFDQLPATLPKANWSNRPSLTLVQSSYRYAAFTPGDRRLAPLVTRLDAIADKAMSHARYILKRGSSIPIDVQPWPYADIDLARFVDDRLRSSGSGPDSWRKTVPSDFLARLPGDSSTAVASLGDPNRAVYFSQEGKLYRVARSFQCAAQGSCEFRILTAAEVAEPLSGDCVQGMLNCQTLHYADGRIVSHLADPHVTSVSGRLWPKSMGVRLSAVPSTGIEISKEEYARHKEVYFPLLRWRLLGSNYIDDGQLYEHVRVCQIDEGADATCEITKR